MHLRFAARIDAAYAAFALTILVAAALLFLLEPMFVKMALPRLGGSSEVWTASVVFYQAMLFGGYAYAHVLGRLRRVRDQALIHGALCLAACAALPFALPATWQPPSAALAVPWLFGALMATVGAPFFVLSATSPLLQAWFAGARPGGNPYLLYAASNVGSLAALLLFPFAIEPEWGLRDQSLAWAAGYVGFAILLVTCALVARTGTVATAAPIAPAEALSWARRARWIGWAFIPSSLMLSVTTYLSERVAPIPLLWTLPLGVYLASFIIVFATRSGRLRDIANRAMPLALLPLVFVLSLHGALPVLPEIALHLVVFAFIALVCHGALARDRPAATQLTEFYLYVALGGVIGGAFNSVLAPLLFHDVYEYPIVLVLACLALAPRADGPRAPKAAFDVALPALLAFVLAASLYGLRTLPDDVQALSGKLVLAGAAIVAFSFVARPMRFALGVAALLALSVYRSGVGTDLHVERNFYGVKHVVAVNGTFHALQHGNTWHGAEDLAAGRERSPLTYFTPGGPVGDVFASRRGTRPAVAVVGLGAGSMACYREPGAAWRFYEIDPGVVSIARDTRYFRYLADCAPESPIIVGDGRLALHAERRHAFDIIVLDAYASDAIPTHLLTREAVQLYLDRLRPHGVIAFHISNSYFDFAPLVAALARDAGAIARVRNDDARDHPGVFVEASSWMVVARATGDLGSLARDPRWSAQARVAPRVWTDDYSSITTTLRALRPGV